jgi:hypothetical protein
VIDLRGGGAKGGVAGEFLGEARARSWRVPDTQILLLQTGEV